MRTPCSGVPYVAVCLLATASGLAQTPKPATPLSTKPALATKKIVVAPTPPAPAAPVTLELPVQKLTLENGLRVVLSVDHTSPTIAVDVVYDVGGRNEERGRSGFAHLFEHMMFQGSAHVPHGHHAQLVSGHGGQLNGSTSSDRTNYFEMMPRSELPLALWLEADRMKALDLSEKNFENQRAVVKEEYRMRVENAAENTALPQPPKTRMNVPTNSATSFRMGDVAFPWADLFYSVLRGFVQRQSRTSTSAKLRGGMVVGARP